MELGFVTGEPAGRGGRTVRDSAGAPPAVGQASSTTSKSNPCSRSLVATRPTTRRLGSSPLLDDRPVGPVSLAELDGPEGVAGCGHQSEVRHFCSPRGPDARARTIARRRKEGESEAAGSPSARGQWRARAAPTKVGRHDAAAPDPFASVEAGAEPRGPEAGLVSSGGRKSSARQSQWFRRC
jgi:hypothetical protein